MASGYFGGSRQWQVDPIYFLLLWDHDVPKDACMWKGSSFEFALPIKGARHTLFPISVRHLSQDIQRRPDKQIVAQRIEAGSACFHSLVILALHFTHGVLRYLQGQIAEAVCAEVG
jgi:hypothetical protein